MKCGLIVMVMLIASPVTAKVESDTWLSMHGSSETIDSEIAVANMDNGMKAIMDGYLSKNDCPRVSVLKAKYANALEDSGKDPTTENIKTMLSYRKCLIGASNAYSVYVLENEFENGSKDAVMIKTQKALTMNDSVKMI